MATSTKAKLVDLTASTEVLEARHAELSHRLIKTGDEKAVPELEALEQALVERQRNQMAADMRAKAAREYEARVAADAAAKAEEDRLAAARAKVTNLVGQTAMRVEAVESAVEALIEAREKLKAWASDLLAAGQDVTGMAALSLAQYPALNVDEWIGSILRPYSEPVNWSSSLTNMVVPKVVHVERTVFAGPQPASLEVEAPLARRATWIDESGIRHGENVDFEALVGKPAPNGYEHHQGEDKPAPWNDFEDPLVRQMMERTRRNISQSTYLPTESAPDVEGVQ